MISCGNFARDCRIHDFGRWERTYAPAIQINGVGCIAANNLLYDGPHSAILFGGNEHLIELNEIHSVCYEVDDAGSIYCGRDWGLRGNIIRHNFFHDIKSNLPGSNGVHAVYLDDCASGITVFGNTFYQISGRAIMCGGGRDNTIENNVIAKCGSAHFTDRRGKVWIDKDESWKLLDKIKRYNYTEPPWSTRYPRLAHILDNGYEQAKEPEGCVIRANIGWQNKRWLEKNCLGACGGFDFYTIENNIEDQDPRFVDEQNLNLALRDDSPAYSLPGFQRIPFEQIGPQDERRRASRLAVSETRRLRCRPERPVAGHHAARDLLGRTASHPWKNRGKREVFARSGFCDDVSHLRRPRSAACHRRAVAAGRHAGSAVCRPVRAARGERICPV